MTHHRIAIAICFVCASAMAQDTTASRLKATSPVSVQDSANPSAMGIIGYVKTVSGTAAVITAGKSVKAALGTPILLGSLLKTGADASLGVSFNDGTLMSFGPQTELTVDEYLYAPAEGKLKLGSKLSRGTLNYVSGVIAKLKPDAVTVSTPTGLIGVRGTQFVAKVDPVPGESGTP